MDDKYNPHDKSSTEPAEGSRENVNIDPSELNVDPHDVNEGMATDNPMERGSGQVSKPEKPLPDKEGGKGGGITNRPLEDEEQNQAELPPRGQAKKD